MLRLASEAVPRLAPARNCSSHTNQDKKISEGYPGAHVKQEFLICSCERIAYTPVCTGSGKRPSVVFRQPVRSGPAVDMNATINFPKLGSTVIAIYNRYSPLGILAEP